MEVSTLHFIGLCADLMVALLVKESTQPPEAGTFFSAMFILLALVNLWLFVDERIEEAKQK
jgi:hypothetical protein